MSEVKVALQADYLLRVARDMSAVRAVAELIWNGLDGDARNVEVSFETRGEGVLRAVDAIRIRDDGHGITHADALHAFEKLGGSWKRPGVRSRVRNRALHGRAGRGRFSGYRLGRRIKWISRADDDGVREIEIAGDSAAADRFIVSEPKALERRRTGTDCIIEGIDPDDVRDLFGKPARVALTRLFAFYLRSNRDVEIVYDGVKLDPADVEAHVQRYDVGATLRDGAAVAAEVEIVEWTIPADRTLYLCDADGFVVHETKLGLQMPGFQVSAYLRAPLFREIDEANQAGVAELRPDVIALIDATRERLREHFRRRTGEQNRNVLETFREEGVYPFSGAAADPVETVERQVFDVVAVNVVAAMPEFERADVKTKRLTLSLMREALAKRPEDMEHILHEVLALPREKLSDLKELLQKTSLSAIIDAAKVVSNRLDFLEFLDQIVFEPELRRTLKERAHLHRIVAENVWLFGEHYHLSIDDQSLLEVLRKHKKLIGRAEDEELAPVVVPDRQVGIVDLMLSRSLPLGTDERENLVIELKRPLQKVDGTVRAQIEDYSTAVAMDERFRNVKVRWSFWAISNEISESIKRAARQVNRPRGLLVDSDGVTVWVKTWSEIIEDARSRLRFFQERLNYMASREDVMKAMGEKYEAYLPSRTKDLKAPGAAGV